MSDGRGIMIVSRHSLTYDDNYCNRIFTAVDFISFRAFKKSWDMNVLSDLSTGTLKEVLLTIFGIIEGRHIIVSSGGASVDPAGFYIYAKSPKSLSCIMVSFPLLYITYY
jgi:hypothetical protein